MLNISDKHRGVFVEYKSQIAHQTKFISFHVLAKFIKMITQDLLPPKHNQYGGVYNRLPQHPQTLPKSFDYFSTCAK